MVLKRGESLMVVKHLKLPREESTAHDFLNVFIIPNTMKLLERLPKAGMSDGFKAEFLLINVHKIKHDSRELLDLQDWR